MDSTFRFSASITSSDPKEAIRQAKYAEYLGYQAVSVADHFDGQASATMLAAAAACATSEVSIITLVLCNDYRHPVVLAQELATLQRLSEGRLIAGLGAGWMKTDYELSGISYDSAGVRIARLAESVQIVKGLLAGVPLDFAGEFYTVKGSLGEICNDLEPVRLMLAGGKKKMLTLAGKHGDVIGINPGLTAGVIDARAGADGTSDKTDQKVQWVREAAGSRFDEMVLQTRVHLADITDDRLAYCEQIAPLLGLSAEQALHSPHCLVGTVDECIETVKMWREKWGISFVSINGDQMEAFAPVVAALAGT